MLQMVVLGSGDAFGSGGRNFSAFLLTDGQRHVLLDCGPATLPALKALGYRPQDVEMILISHCHGDHFGGIPFFFIEYQFLSERHSPLVIIGPKGLQGRCSDLIQATYPDVLKAHAWRFQIRYKEILPGQQDHQEEGIRIEAFSMEHGSVPALGYRVTWGGLRVGYTGDTKWTDEILRLARGCRLLLCECFFFDQDHHSHLRYLDIMKYRQALEAERILLFHLGPEMIDRIKELELEVAQEGAVIDLGH